MPSIRLQRVAEQVAHVVGRVVTQELKDPRCGFVTILGVQVASDLRSARVRFSVLGTDSQKRTAQRALESARGFVQARVAQETGLKYTPVITFQLDDSVERDIELSQKIREAVQADRRAGTARSIRARVAGGSIPEDVAAEVSALAGSDEFIESVARFLMDLMAIDTSTRADVAAAAEHERRCLERIRDELHALWGDGVRTEFLPVDPEIESDEAYTRPAHAADADGGVPPAGRVYAERANLMAVLRRGDFEEPAEPPEDGLRPLWLLFNAHVDTVPPYVPPSRDGDIVRGRGACDAKGQVATIVAAFRLLRHLRDRFGLQLRRDVGAQFVIDEETGGNGTLSIALQDPFVFDGVVVCECTGLQVHAANRGAVWYRAELTAPADRLAELAAHIVLALEDEGRALKNESDHPLFPDRPVPTNHGVLGPFGSGPSTVCDLVEIEVLGASEAAAHAAAARAVEDYCTVYGDKALETDPDTGAPKIPRHFTLETRGDRLVVRVHGKAGHMGSLAACDSAVTKAAYVLRELARLREGGADVSVRLRGHEGETLVLEGAQGFLPTHRLAQVTRRLRSAAERAAVQFRRQARLEAESVGVRVTFDKLHNEAFARAADCTLAVYAAESCRRAGIEVPARPVGWESSCDARLFADLFADRDVIVFGPGQLRHAHAAEEQISLRDIAAGAKMLAFLILEATGFVR